MTLVGPLHACKLTDWFVGQVSFKRKHSKVMVGLLGGRFGAVGRSCWKKKFAPWLFSRWKHEVLQSLLMMQLHWLVTNLCVYLNFPFDKSGELAVQLSTTTLQSASYLVRVFGAVKRSQILLGKEIWPWHFSRWKISDTEFSVGWLCWLALTSAHPVLLSFLDWLRLTFLSRLMSSLMFVHIFPSNFSLPVIFKWISLWKKTIFWDPLLWFSH